MAECEWAVICDYAFLDARGKMCLIGIFDRIFAKTVPASHPQAALVVQLRGKPQEAIAVRIEIVRPTGGVLKRVEASGQMSDSGGAGLQLAFAPIQLPDYGDYQCCVFVNDERSYTARFVVARPASSGPN